MLRDERLLKRATPFVATEIVNVFAFVGTLLCSACSASRARCSRSLGPALYAWHHHSLSVRQVAHEEVGSKRSTDTAREPAVGREAAASTRGATGGHVARARRARTMRDKGLASRCRRRWTGPHLGYRGGRGRSSQAHFRARRRRAKPRLCR